MTTHELPDRGAVHAPGRTEGFADSFSLFALIVMLMFVVATAFALVGLATPSWLGFS